MAHGDGRQRHENNVVVTNNGDHAKLARDHGLVRGGADARGEDAVVGRRTAPALKVTKHGRSNFETALLFYFRGEKVPDAARGVTNAADAFVRKISHLGSAQNREVDAFRDDDD